jgi:hypothetical protein
MRAFPFSQTEHHIDLVIITIICLFPTDISLEVQFYSLLYLSTLELYFRHKNLKFYFDLLASLKVILPTYEIFCMYFSLYS